MQSFADLAGAVSADEDDEPAEDVEERPGALEDPLLAADHDRQRRVHRAAWPAADRRVEHVELGTLCGEPPGERGRARRHVDEERPGVRLGAHALGAEHGLLDGLWRGEREEHRVDLCEGHRLLDAEGLAPGGVEIARDHVVPCLDQVPRHRQAHRPETDHGDAHGPPR